MNYLVAKMNYFGNHFNTLHKCGGYTTNERGAIGYSAEMDRKDGQVGLLNHLEKTYMISQKQADYKGLQGKPMDAPYCLPGSTYFGRSGYANSAAALHRPKQSSVIATKMGEIGSLYNTATNANSSCLVPESMVTETRERFHTPSYERLAWKLWYADPRGNKDTGYTSAVSTYNPVMWRQIDPNYDHAGQFIEPRLNIRSVSQTDYQPFSKRTGYEPTPLITSKGASGTGYTTAKELAPCFVPPTKVYGERDRAYDDPEHYLTTYTHEYPPKSGYCDSTGIRLVGKGPTGTAAAAMEDNVNMDYGHTGNMRTETEESFLTPWPLPGNRHFWLGRPLEAVSKSGFASAGKRHTSSIGKCGAENPYDLTNSNDPQRYNPWPRLALGHAQLVHNTFRPNPVTYGINYNLYTAAPTTTNESTTVIY